MFIKQLAVYFLIMTLWTACSGDGSVRGDFGDRRPQGSVGLTIGQDIDQFDPYNGFPIHFDVSFDAPIRPESLTASDIIQLGTASDVTWSITNSGDDTNFVISATSAQSYGTIIPSLPEKAATDENGYATIESTSLQNNLVTYQQNQAPLSLEYPNLTNRLPRNFNKSFPPKVEGGKVSLYQVIAGSIPSGMTLNPSTGELSGSPTTGGQYIFTIEASNGSGSTTFTFTIRVEDSFVVNDDGDEAWDGVQDNVCNSTNGTCTLRAAIDEIADGSATKGIVFEDTVTSITLGSTLATGFGKDLFVFGNGIDNTKILGGGSASDFRMLHTSGGVVSYYFFDLSIENFSRTQNGSVLLNEGGLAYFFNVRFENNISTVSGGALSANNGLLVPIFVASCEFVSNQGTAIKILNGAGGGKLSVNNTNFDSNITLGFNIGGAIAYGGAGTLEITNSSFYNNSALGAGAISINATHPSLEVTNNSFYGNSAFSLAGAIHVQLGDVSIINNTIIGNSNTAGSDAGGISISAGSTTIGNNIIMNNDSNGTINNCSGVALTSIGNNLFDQIDCDSVGADITDGLLINLDSFQIYGGTTYSIPLLPNSKAIDAGANGICPISDQRGKYRPVNGTCDIGAFETQN